MTTEIIDREDRGLGYHPMSIVSRVFGYETYSGANELKGLFTRMFDEARKNIRLSEGEFSHHVFEEYGVIDALKRAVERGVKIELIGHQDPDPESKKLWQLVEEGKIDYYQTSVPEATHFAVIDYQHVLEEYPHLPQSVDREGSITGPKSNNQQTILDSVRKFTELKDQGRKVESLF